MPGTESSNEFLTDLYHVTRSIQEGSSLRPFNLPPNKEVFFESERTECFGILSTSARPLTSGVSCWVLFLQSWLPLCSSSVVLGTKSTHVKAKIEKSSARNYKNQIFTYGFPLTVKEVLGRRHDIWVSLKIW